MLATSTSLSDSAAISAVLIDLKDARGNTVFGGLPSFGPILLPVGWQICFGPFSHPPSVSVGGN
jgi:hypothetical protein